MAIRPKKIMITSLSPLRSLREKKKQRAQPGAKQATPANIWVGFIPILSAKHNVGVGFIPIHQAQQRLTASAARYPFNAWCPTVAGCGPRGRPPKNLLSLVYGGPLWPSAKKIYDHFFASYAPLREMKKQRVQSVMCECKTN